MNLEGWENKFEAKLRQQDKHSASHDLSHFYRVVAAAKYIAKKENADLNVVVPSAWLHDLVTVPKNSPERPLASSLAAKAACAYLQDENYPEHLLPKIFHCIQAHSFSGGFDTNSLEAEVVQDADRLDAIGAIGIARCFSNADTLDQSFYHKKEPFAKTRSLDELKYTLDHFYVKLLKIAESMKTKTAKKEAERRCEFMRQFLKQFQSELIYPDS